MRKPPVKPFGADITSGRVGSILARFFRIILTDLKIDAERYNSLMQRYIQRAHQNQNPVVQMEARARLSKDLMKDEMTWKTWIKGVMGFLSVIRIDFTVRLHHSTGRITSHTTTWMTDEEVTEEDDEKPETEK